MFASTVPYFVGIFGHIIETVAVIGGLVGLGYTVYFFATKGK